MSEEKLAKLRGSKNVYLRHIKNLEREVNDIVKNFAPENEETVVKLNSLKLAYTDKNNKLKELDDSILDILPPNEIEKEIETSLQREEISFDILAKINHYLSKVHVSNDSRPKISSINCKLPKIEIPKFSGDILAWQGFYDSFSSTIDRNEHISNVEKFTYLRSFLTDNALSLISGLSLSDSNYNEALKCLKDRYDNEQVLVNAYMKRFVELPVIKLENDFIGLRKMYDQIQTSIRNLNSLKKPTETYGLLLVHLLSEKLPTEIRIIISRKFENRIWDLNEMLDILKAEIEAKERSSTTEEKTNKLDWELKDFSSSALYTSTTNRENKKFDNKPRCVFCDLTNHASNQCRKITEPNMRRQVLQMKRLCFICFKKGHISRNCDTKYNCVKCKTGKHHYSLCIAEPKGQSEQTTNNLSNGRNNILLQTAQARVFNLSETKSVDSNILFDSGSQRTYICESVREKLNIPIIRKEKQ